MIKIDGKIINVAEYRARNDPNKDIVFRQAVEELDDELKVKGYWLINQWGDKLSFHRNLKQLSLYIIDGWGSWLDFKILV